MELQISFALIKNLGKTMDSLSSMSEKIRFKIRASSNVSNYGKINPTSSFITVISNPVAK